MNRWIGLLLFLFLFAFYLHNAAPSVTTGDSGEFITAAHTLSLPHSPSFPLFSLAGKSFISMLPFGSVPYRCNAFSAFLSAATVVLVFNIGLSLGVGAAIALLTALLVGVTASLWENSLVTEVFALNTFFTALLLLCLVKRRPVLFAFLLGLGVGNHQILIMTAPVFAVAFFSMRSWRLVAVSFLFFLIGFSIYAVLPIRAVKDPPLNWGKPATVDKFIRTVTRKDYGSLTLALGEAPERNVANTWKHIRTFFRHMSAEASWPALLTAMAGLLMGIWRRDRFTLSLLTLAFITGPFFFWLGNLPFTGQSDGIVGRFMIMPALALLLAIPGLFEKRRRLGLLLLTVSIITTFQRNVARAEAHRSSTLVLDYGRAMMRTMPKDAVFFMEGGDDAFYSMAMLRYVAGLRPDLQLHDRGGLVFKSPYGEDFRSLPKEMKAVRRINIERAAMERRPLYYSTMDKRVIPGVELSQRGFLMGMKESPSMDWSLVLLRSLYPLEPNLYRMRALGAFFPYMRGRQFFSEGRWREALPFFQRAESMGRDVDWLHNNLSGEYAMFAYEKLLAKDYEAAEAVYRRWIAFDPRNMQPQSNLGVVLERTGRIDEAVAQYERTAELFPAASDPVFNLSVLAWKRGDWPRVVTYLEEVMRRNPDHPGASGYLKAARQKAGLR